MAVRCRALDIFAAQLGIRYERLLRGGIQRDHIVLFQLVHIDFRTVLDDFILAWNLSRGGQTVNERMRITCRCFRQHGHQLQHAILVVVHGQRVACLNARPHFFVIVHLVIAADVDFGAAFRPQRFVFRNNTIRCGADDLVGFRLVVVRHDADSSLAAPLAYYDRSVYANQAVIQRTRGLSRCIHGAVLVKQRFISGKCAVRLAGFQQDAVFHSRGGDLVQQGASLFSLFVGAERIEQHYGGLSALYRSADIGDGNAVRQTDGLCLREIVRRPERADVLLLVTQHTQQHRADFTIADDLIRAELAVRVTADDGLFLELRMAYRCIDIRRSPVSLFDIREDSIALVSAYIRNTHRRYCQLAELSTGQCPAGCKRTAAHALHDAECIQYRSCLRHFCIRNVGEYR